MGTCCTNLLPIGCWLSGVAILNARRTSKRRETDRGYRTPARCLRRVSASRRYGQQSSIAQHRWPFKRPLDQLRRTNVDGTCGLARPRRKLSPAAQEGRLLVSMICVHGDRTGLTPETPVAEAPHFVNPYEQSKWEAERLVLDSGLPAEIVRLAIVAGSESDGAVRSPGALHHALYWLYKGLIPMIPGTPEAGVDRISNQRSLPRECVAATLGAPTPQARGASFTHRSRLSGCAAWREVSCSISWPATSSTETALARWASGARCHGRTSWTATPLRSSKSPCTRAATSSFGVSAMTRNASSRCCSTLRTSMTSLAQSVPTVDWRTLAERVAAWLIATDWSRKANRLPFNAFP